MKSFSISRKNKYKGNNNWYGKINDNGKIRFISLKTEKKCEAKQWLDVQNAEKFIPESMKINEKDFDLIESVTRYIKMIEISKGPESKTIAAYKSRLNHLVKYSISHQKSTLKSFKVLDAVDFSLKITEKYASKTSLEIIKLSISFFKWCDDVFDLGGHKPFKGIKMPKVTKKMVEFWTMDQIENIIENSPDIRYKTIWSLMAYAGLRYNEAINCKFDDIIDGKIRIKGKGGKIRTIPLSNKLKSILADYQSATKIYSGNIFDETFSRRNEDLIVALRVTVARAKLDNPGIINNHKFRHSFASELLRKGVNVKIIQELMGHSSVTITLGTYCHVLRTDLVEAVNII